MLNPRSLLLRGAVTLPLVIGGCVTKSSSSTAPVAAASEGDKADKKSPTRADKPKAGKPKGERIKFKMTVNDLEDQMEGLKKFSASYQPDNASDPKADLQAGLLTMGFGPGFVNNLDFKGLHAVSASIPPGEDARPQDMRLWASLAVVDGRKLIEATPAAFRPQPMGDGVWEFQRDDNRFLLKEAGKELFVGLNNEDLAKAAKLGGKSGKDRFKVRVANLPLEDVDPFEALDLPRNIPMAKQIREVVNKLKAVELTVDNGSERDAAFVARAEGPFHLLGLDPIGKPRKAPTTLESKLPPAPVFVTTYSWGDPAVLHKTMDTLVPMDQVPAPFVEMVKSTMAGMHGLLDQLANDVAFGLYLDKKGQAAVVIAADVKDGKATKEGIRKIDEAIVKAIEMQRLASSQNKDGQFAVEFKPGAVKLSGTKGDRITVTVPKEFEEDLSKGAPFIKGKNKIPVVSFVRNETAAVVIGAAATSIAGMIAKNAGKPAKNTLATDPGLAMIRESMGGCQVCMAGDPLEYMRFRLMLVKGSDKSKAKGVKAQLASLRKAKDVGQPGAGMRFQKQKAAVGVVVPQAALFTPKSNVDKLKGVLTFLGDISASEDVGFGVKQPAQKPSRQD